MTDTVIRASSTSSYADCPRRGAARSFRDLVESFGFSLRSLPPHIGAVIGTATHVAVYSALAEKITTGALGNQTEAEQRALDSLTKDTEHGVSWDEVTTTMNTAQRQVIKQARTYRSYVAEKIDPLLVEEALDAHAESGVVVSGHVDVYDRSGTLVGDLKTGKWQRWNAPQYGSYSMLLRSHGFPVQRIEEHYVKRVRVDDDQPRPEITSYDVGQSERASALVIKRIGRDLAEFRETGNPDAFLPNPMSVLCSDKFCSAHSTSFCSAWKK